MKNTPLILLATLGLALSAEAAVTYRKVALTGDTADGSGGTFTAFTTFSMNGGGEVALYGVVSSISGNAAGAVDGVWSEQSGALKRIVSYGQSAAGTAGTFTLFSATPVIRDTGNVAFRGTATGALDGVWAGTPSSGASVAAVEGMTVPGLGAGVTLSSIDYGSSDIPVFSPLGRVAFLGTVTGTGITAGVNDKIIYTAGGGSLQQVARKGDQPPGVPAGAKYNTLSIPDSYSPNGVLSFRADMSTGSGGVVTATKYGIWSGTPAALALTARAGDAVDLSYTYSVPDIRQSLNAAGSICFSSTLTGFFGTGPGLVSGNGSLSIIARQGQVVPDIAGASFANDPSTGGGAANYRFAMASNGVVAFEAPVAGTGITTANTWGLFVYSGGTITTVLRQGQQLPEGPAGVVIKANVTDPLLNTTPVLYFHVNKYGHLMAMVQLSGTGVTTSNNLALIAMDHTGTWKLLARKGSSFTLPGGGSRTVSSLIMVNSLYGTGESGKAGGWTDAGQALIRLDFSDASSGIFVATVYDGPVGNDWDNDGLPNTWETANGLDPNSDTGVNGAGGDLDLDGATNFQEYVAGTFANDNTSLLTLSNYQFIEDGRMTFQFPSLSSRNYKVWYKETPDATVWLEDSVTFPGIDGVYTYYLFTPLVRGVYRLEVSLP